jgi:UDP-glucose 4-epimerase
MDGAARLSAKICAVLQAARDRTTLMHVLLTGAGGNLGREALAALVRAGHRVRTFDLDTRATRKVLEPFATRAELTWGDLTNPSDVQAAVRGVQAIIHNGALVMPRSELEPDEAYRVNVSGTANVLDATRAEPGPVRFVYASSVSVFGRTQPGLPPPRRANDATLAQNHYTSHKLECERLVQQSGLPFSILRIGVSPPLAPEGGDPAHLRFLFAYALDSRVEYVHPRDVGLAEANALSCDEALGKVLLIGGGPRCQITVRKLINGLFERVGVGALPEEAFGREAMFADWLDTEESQALLRYQHHTFDDALDEIVGQLGAKRFALRLARPIVRRLLLKYSARGAP